MENPKQIKELIKKLLPNVDFGVFAVSEVLHTQQDITTYHISACTSSKAGNAIWIAAFGNTLTECMDNFIEKSTLKTNKYEQTKPVNS